MIKLKFNYNSIYLVPVLALLLNCNSKSESNGNTNTAQPTTDSLMSEEKVEAKMAFTARENDIERAMDTLIWHCTKKNYEVIAESMLYNGEDKNRKWKEIYKIADGKDYEIVRITADVINGWVDEADSYVYGKLSDAQENQLKWKIQEVIFTSKAKIHRKNFSFMQKDGKYYLINIKSP